MTEQTPIYRGTYFSGQPGAVGLPVEIMVEPEGLRLLQDRHISYFWPAHQIHPHAYRKGDLTILEFGTEPRQQLEVISPDFALTIKEAYPEAVFHRNALPAPKSKKSALFFLILLMLGGLLAAYFWLLPALANLVVNQLPPEAEVTIGQELYEQLMAEEDVDTLRTRAANQFLQQLNLPSSYPLHVTVVQEATMNAYALPGGHLVLYTGLLDSLQTSAELAALLGHEFAHAQNRHTLRAMARSFSTYLLLSMLFNDISGLAAVFLENADKLESLQYSRALEEEADAVGFAVLQRNHLDPKGMQQLFLRLEAAGGTEDNTPALLSTHPLTSERLAHLQQLIEQNPYPVQPTPALEAAWQQVMKR